MSATGGGSWGESYSSSLGTDTGFTGYVGSLPDKDLTGEQFEWRMFMCKRDVVPGFPVWVQGYQVRNYLGEFQEPSDVPGKESPEDLGPVGDLSPRQSEKVSTTPELSWNQPVGTVQDYTVELEAVGRFDPRDFTVRPSDATGKTLEKWPETAGRTDTTSFTVPVDDEMGPLLPNQLYRWRAVSNNFFFKSEPSPWEFFVTQGPPEAKIAIDDFAGYGVIDEPLALRRTGDDGGLPVTTTWSVDGVKIEPTDPGDPDSVDWTPTRAGWHVIRVVAENDAGTRSATESVLVVPGSVDETYRTSEDVRLDVDAPGVLANDAGATSAELVSTTPRGVLSFGTDGSFEWDPPAGVCGDEAATAFQYRPFTGWFGSFRIAVAAIEVDCADNAPVARDDTFEGTQGEPVIVGAPGVLANDDDPDLAEGEELTAELVAGPAGGEVELNPDGSFTYTPGADTCEDSFTYRVRNGDAVGNTATVTLVLECDPDGGDTGPGTPTTTEPTPSTTTTAVPPSTTTTTTTEPTPSTTTTTTTEPTPSSTTTVPPSTTTTTTTAPPTTVEPGSGRPPWAAPWWPAPRPRR